jgi:hypothetical protein
LVSSVEECLQIVKSMKLNVAPVPYGLNVAFYKVAWTWIKQDIQRFFMDFYTSGEFPNPLNYTKIVLVPKK